MPGPDEGLVDEVLSRDGGWCVVAAPDDCTLIATTIVRRPAACRPAGDDGPAGYVASCSACERQRSSGGHSATRALRRKALVAE
jgi:hypothetical protein